MLLTRSCSIVGNFPGAIGILEFLSGFGALEETSGVCDVILLENYLEKKLWLCEDGDEYVEETTGNFACKTWNFSARLRRFQEVTVVFTAGLLKSEISWYASQVDVMGYNASLL